MMREPADPADVHVRFFYRCGIRASIDGVPAGELRDWCVYMCVKIPKEP